MKTHKWQLQEAKNRLSEVVEEALAHGPQIVTRRGQDTAVILSFNDYQKLLSPQQNLLQFFRQAPGHGDKLWTNPISGEKQPQDVSD